MACFQARQGNSRYGCDDYAHAVRYHLSIQITQVIFFGCLRRASQVYRVCVYDQRRHYPTGFKLAAVLPAGTGTARRVAWAVRRPIYAILPWVFQNEAGQMAEN